MLLTSSISVGPGAAERLRLPAIAAYALQNLGAALFHQGRLDEALETEREALETVEGGRDPRNEGFCLVYLGKIEARRGDLAAAEASMSLALAALETIPPALAYAKAELAALLRELGQLDRADRLAVEASETLEELGGIDEGEAQIRLQHARAMLRGDGPAALDALAAAHQRLEERAAKISDPDWRRSFLENVPENRETCQLWSSRGAAIS